MMDAPVSLIRRETRGQAISRGDVLVAVALLVVMVVGGYLRFVGQNWDDFVRFHPDERFLSGVVANLNGTLYFTDDDTEGQYQRCLKRYPESGGRGGFFDAQCSPMNPHNTGSGLYVYGTLPSFLVRWLADFTVRMSGDPSYGTYTGVHLVGRTLSALAEMGVILTVFFVGVTLHDKWIGLLAAALYSVTVFSIQQAHFWTTDATANLFVTLGILFAARVQRGGRLLDYALFGLVFGAALASRINTLPLAGLLLGAAALRVMPILDLRLAWHERGRLLTGAATGLVLAGIGTIIIFRLFNPYAFLGPGILGISPNPRWLADVAEAQFLVSGKAESPPNWQWVGRTPYLFPFQNMMLWGMGLALGLTGWLAWIWSGWRLLRGRPGALSNVLPVVWVLVYFGWLGNLWVMTMRYYLPLYPMLALLAAWALVEIIRRAARTGIIWRVWSARALLVGVAGLTVLWALMFTNIYRHLFAPAAASHWIWENVPGDFAMRIENSDAPLINIAVPNLPGGGDIPLELQASQYNDGSVFTTTFIAPADGTIKSIYSPHLGQLAEDSGAADLRFTISATDGSVTLAEGKLNARLPRDAHILGDAYDIPLNMPLVVAAGTSYSFSVRLVSGGPVISAGAVFTWEGDWDEPVPPKVCALPQGITLADDPPPGLASAITCNGRDLWGGLINGYKLQVYWEEETYKRDHFLRVLNDTDYLIIGTNRRYDSQSRIAYRWPMTVAYYDALFSGELGFELVETFHQTYELGPLRISDQHLPTYTSPEWLNEFEAEEAFHVYDHPAVFIFRKTEAYSPERTLAILDSVSLNKPDIVFGSFNDPAVVGVVPLYSLPADAAPTLLKFPPELKETQTSGGTWSERFDSASPVNTQPVMTILMWWVAMLIFGWAAWPLLFALLPGLADRGYGFAKLGGLLLVGWLAWFVSSARIPMWSQSGVALALLVVLAASLIVGWRRRAELADYIRRYGLRLMWIEIITLLAFVFFLLIRLTNPDLWHPSFGGEKPMDFAYFNGVLRSTVFPPVDPWHAGGFINYYYWGYVLVGSPVLLLGIMPSIAYNLIIPTLFALTGVGAFSAAFNLVSALNQARAARSAPPAAVDDEPDHSQTTADPQSSSSALSLGNAWVAGLAALLLAVVLGNLDTPRVFVAEALSKTGFYQNPAGLQDYLIREYIEANEGRSPTGDDMLRIVQQANDESQQFGTSVLRGLTRALRNQPLDIAPNRWYWAPTRILSEPPVSSGGAIVEMPFFTFLYGDLHAHMIAMPMVLLAVACVLNELLLAGRDPRRRLMGTLGLALAGLTVGLLRATNTWDWITFMLLTVVGLVYAWWLQFGRINRLSLLHLAGRVGAFVLFSFALSLPYLSWYASVYNSARGWEGPVTPLWAYFTIHGLFLFLLVSLLVWETGRTLRSLYVRSLRGKLPILTAAFIGLLGLLAGMLLVAVRGYPVTVIAGPLIVWIALLFFRPGQSREMQFVLALAGLALSLTLGVEFIVLDGDVGRQNTVFKFYIQAWLLFSVVGGAALAWLLDSAPRWPGLTRNAWYVLGCLLLAVAAIYPLMATRGRALDRMADVPLTLDGAEFMKTALLYEGSPNVIQDNPSVAPFPLLDDYNMIRWLQDHIQGTPIIIEGQADREYRWQSRVAIYTGLPSVIGWNFHQRQQRTLDPMPRLVQQRVANVNAFYTTTDIPTAWNILQRYDVSYVIVSSLERAYYPASSLAKFQDMVEAGLLEVVYAQGASIVYKVNKDDGFRLSEGT